MVNIIKRKLREQVLKKIDAKIAQVGTDKSLMASAAALRRLGSVSRAALLDCMLTAHNWGKLRKTPDVETFNKLTAVLNNLDDIDRANMVFSQAGEGAAWVYLEEVKAACEGTNNRFTREINDTIAKARLKNGK